LSGALNQLSDKDTAIGVGGGGNCEVFGNGVRLDGATYDAGRAEATALGIPAADVSHVSLFLGGLRSGQSPYVLNHEHFMMEFIIDYLYHRGENVAALNGAMTIV
jgi:hypothetical protein